MSSPSESGPSEEASSKPLPIAKYIQRAWTSSYKQRERRGEGTEERSEEHHRGGGGMLDQLSNRRHIRMSLIIPIVFIHLYL